MSRHIPLVFLGLTLTACATGTQQSNTRLVLEKSALPEDKACTASTLEDINFRELNSGTQRVYDEAEHAMMTVNEHEGKHIDDINHDLSEETLNSESFLKENPNLRTEGFTSKADCEQARGNMRGQLILYRSTVKKNTHQKRDKVTP